MDMIHEGLICLLKSAVTGEAARLPEDFSMEEAYAISAKQGVLPLLFQGAVNSGLPRTAPVMQKLRMDYYRYMIRSERQQRAVGQLLEAFAENAIDHMPLKGCNMRALYPKPELRPMGDADILIRQEQMPRCRAVMESLDFTPEQETDHTDNWTSTDLYVELHKSLVPPEDEDYYAYYGTGWRIAVKGEGHRHDPTPEDTFVFLFTHFARHYRISGIGCRHVVDLYVYRRAYPGLNEKYIREELKKLHLLEFYRNTLRLLDVWFGDGRSDAVTELMTAFVFSGGSWGTMEAGLYSQELKSAAKKGRIQRTSAHALLYAVFPPLSYIKNRYPILRRWPVLLPVMWVRRWVDVVLFSRDRLKKKMGILRRMDDQGILGFRQALETVGLRYD